MATRLYPDTTDDVLLERLARVPVGTAAKLRAFEEERRAAEPVEDQRNRTLVRLLEWTGKVDPDVHYDQAFLDAGFRTADLLREQPDLDTLAHFRLFGWGRLSAFASEAVEAAGLEPVCGGTRDRALVRRLVFLQGRIPNPHEVLAILEAAGVGLSWG